jgi:hypothetical protein
MSSTQSRYIAMWSGPRNISTAMLRSWGNRADTWVIDEPFYAHYLTQTEHDHPGADDIIAAYEHDWRKVVEQLTGAVPHNKAIYYQKHMTHHMLPEFGRDWLGRVRNAFLIRAPEAVLASYVKKRASVALGDIGVVQQRELFDREADRLGAPPPVVDAADVLSDPARVLARLCAALGLDYTEAMLRWPAGRRATDGVWAPAWYAAVERSTRVETAPHEPAALTPELQPIADAARPHDEAMAVHRLR